MSLPVLIKLPDSLIEESQYFTTVTQNANRSTIGSESYTNPRTLATYSVPSGGQEALALYMYETNPALKNYIFSDDTYAEIRNQSIQYEYQTPTVVAQEIRVTKPSSSNIIKFQLTSAVTGGAITISLDGGATSFPLYEEDGVTAITSLDIGFQEVVYATSFFTLRPKGILEAIYGKRDGAEITLVNSKGQPVVIKQGEYAYMNETVALFLTSPIETIYDRTTPVQVVNAAYDTSGNGGRKLVRLDNGWLVSGALNGTTVQFYVSKDKGGTFIPLCNIAGWNTTNFAITSSGNFIYVLINNASVFAVASIKFDATTVTNTNILSTAVTVDNAQTAIGFVSLAIDSNGHLHAAWSSKNATYPNSFNIRYSKSTDGSVTWASPTQVTVYNATTDNCIDPDIKLNGNNNAVIIYNRNRPVAVNDRIEARIETNFTTVITIHAVASYNQLKPSSDILSDNTMGCIWQGYSASNPSTYHIYFKTSVDNGVTWLPSTPIDVAIGEKPSLTRDSNDRWYITYERSGVSYWKYSDDGTTWSAEQSLATGTNTSTVNNYRNFENPMTLFDGGADVKFYGKWTESNSPQIIPSLATATAESELQAIGDGTLKSFGSTDKFYVGYHSKVSNGFTPL